MMMVVYLLLLMQINIFCAISIKSRCDPFEVCNVVHNRYWMSNLVEKQCLCPKHSFCSSSYRMMDNNTTMRISSRTQMNLCSPLPEPPKPICANNELSVIQTHDFNKVKTTIRCMCNRTSYLKYYSKKTDKQQRSVTFSYKCRTMPTCEPNQFCGYSRSDLGFVYQKCTCPERYNCATRSSSDILNGKMHELFYNGTVYESHCVSFVKDHEIVT